MKIITLPKSHFTENQDINNIVEVNDEKYIVTSITEDSIILTAFTEYLGEPIAQRLYFFEDDLSHFCSEEDYHENRKEWASFIFTSPDLFHECWGVNILGYRLSIKRKPKTVWKTSTYKGKQRKYKGNSKYNKYWVTLQKLPKVVPAMSSLDLCRTDLSSVDLENIAQAKAESNRIWSSSNL